MAAEAAAVQQAARLAHLAGPGQILASALVRQLIGEDADLRFGEDREVSLPGLAGRMVVNEVRWGEHRRRVLRVVIADDAALVRDGVAALLRAHGVEVAGTASDSAGLHEEVARHLPDVALVDIRMPPTFTDEGLVAAERIRARFPEVGVLVLSQHLDARYALRVARANPARTGYLLKDRVTDSRVLFDALERIADGGCVIDAAVAEGLVTRASALARIDELTERERQVLALVAEGRSNRAIAELLVVTPKTVETHIGQIFLKLGLREAEGEDRRVAAVLAYLQASDAALRERWQGGAGWRPDSRRAARDSGGRSRSGSHRPGASMDPRLALGVDPIRQAPGTLARTIAPSATAATASDPPTANTRAPAWATASESAAGVTPDTRIAASSSLRRASIAMRTPAARSSARLAATSRYTAASAAAGKRRSGSASTATPPPAACTSASTASASPPSASVTEWMPWAISRSWSRIAATRTSASAEGLGRGAVGGRPCPRQSEAERQQPLLRAVVEVALQAAALGLAGGHEPQAGLAQLRAPGGAGRCAATRARASGRPRRPCARASPVWRDARPRRRSRRAARRRCALAPAARAGGAGAPSGVIGARVSGCGTRSATAGSSSARPSAPTTSSAPAGAVTAMRARTARARRARSGRQANPAASAASAAQVASQSGASRALPIAASASTATAAAETGAASARAAAGRRAQPGGDERGERRLGRRRRARRPALQPGARSGVGGEEQQVVRAVEAAGLRRVEDQRREQPGGQDVAGRRSRRGRAPPPSARPGTAAPRARRRPPGGLRRRA